MLKSKRDYEMKKATYDVEVEMARAESELATKLQESKVRQRIMDASKSVEVIERIKMIEVAEQEVARKKCELDSKVLKPAEAEKIKMQVLAEANHKKSVIEAEGAAAALDMKVH